MGIETIITRAKKDKPDVIVLDQVDKLSLPNGKYNANHERLKELYTRTRELAKEGQCLVINVCQASVMADDYNEITYDMMDGSKTGKAGEADIIIGIGKRSFLTDQPLDVKRQIRYIKVSKNKINGWHGAIMALFNPTTYQWEEADNDANCY